MKAYQNLVITGSLSVTGSMFMDSASAATLENITGSLYGTASYSITSSYTLTSSYSETASFAKTASFAVTASFLSGTIASLLVGVSGTYGEGNLDLVSQSLKIYSGSDHNVLTAFTASTGEFNLFLNNQLNVGGVTGSSFTGSFTGSYLGSGTGSWVGEFSGSATGSLIGQFTGSATGSLVGTFTGSATGSLIGDFTGSGTGSFTGSFTGSLEGTSSYALTASYLSGSLTSVLLGISGTVGTGSVDIVTQSLNILGGSSNVSTSFDASIQTVAIDLGPSLNISNAVTASSFTGSFTGSLFGSASYAFTASYVSGSITGVDLRLTGSFGSGAIDLATQSLTIIGQDANITASYVSESLTLNLALGQQLNLNGVTGSSFTGSFTGSLNGTASYAETSSIAINSISSSYLSGSRAIVENLQVYGTASVNYLDVVYQTSSYIVSTGSNKFGDQTVDIQEFTGSVGITGSLTMDTASVAIIPNLTGSLYGTASYALIGITASYVSGSNVDGTVSSSFTASLADTASFAYTASYVSGSNVNGTVSSSYTASIADLAYTASYVSGSNVNGTVSSSYTASIADLAYTASYVSGSNVFGTVSSSYTASQADTSYTASYVSGSNVDGTVSSSFTASLADRATTASYAISASYLSGSSAIVDILIASTASIEYLTAVYVTSSVAFSSGSNVFGDQVTDVHQFTGSVGITGSFTMTSASVATIPNLTGSLHGTASYALTASFAQNAGSSPATVIISASAPAYTQYTGALWYNTTDGNTYIQIAGNDTSSSLWVPSFGGTVGYATSASVTLTASYVLNAVSASYATSASYALSGSYVNSASTADTASLSYTASYISGSGVKGTVSSSFTASQADTSYTASYVSGSNVKGTVSASFTASLADFATSASQALSASYLSGSSAVVQLLNVVGTGSVKFLNAQDITGSTLTITGSVKLGSATGSLVTITGSVGITGSLTSDASTKVTIPNLTGSLFGTASYAWTASQAISASYLSGSSATVENLTVFGTASVKFLNVSIQSASVVLLSGSNFFGDQLSDTQYFTGSVGITGSLNVAANSPATIPNLTGSLFGTASYAWTASQAVTSSYLSGSSATIQLLNVVGTGSIKYLDSQDITASTITVTGSSKFGASLNTTHSFTGSVGITGSLTMPTYSIATLPTVIGDLIGTASWVATSSYTVIARSVVQVTSSAPVQEYSGSLWYNTEDGNTYVQVIGAFGATWVPVFGGTVGYATTSSYALSSSYFSGTFAGDVTNSISTSYISGSGVDGYVLGAFSASLAENARTASYVQTALTASWISGSNVFGTVSSSFTASLANQAATSYTASYVSGSNVKGTVSSSFTASLADQAATSYTASYVSGSNVKGTVSSSYTASQADTSYTASYVSGSNVKGTVSSSFTASLADRATTASFSLSSSYLSGSSAIIQNLEVVGTASIRYLFVQYESASAIVLTGSSKFGDDQLDRQEFTGSVGITGSLVMNSVSVATIPNLTGSLFGTASFAVTTSYISGSNVKGTVSSSYTASQADTSYTASYISGSNVKGTVSSSYTASLADFATSGSVTQTASYLSGSSLVVGSGSIRNLNVFNLTASTAIITGSSVFGQSLSTTQSFTGSIGLTGSMFVDSSSVVTIQNLTASMFGTASYALQALTSSYMLGTASFAETASTTIVARSVVIVSQSAPVQEYSGSLWYNTTDGNMYVQIIGAGGGTWVPSFGGTVGYATSASFALTASYFANVIASSSFATSASYAYSSSYVNSASVADTASLSYTASYISGSHVKGTVSASFTASQADTSYTASYISGSNVKGTVSASFTASLADFATSGSVTQTASYLSGSSATVQQILVIGTGSFNTVSSQNVTASNFFVTGSSRLGSVLTNTHVITGSVSLTGSLTADGATKATLPNLTGSLFGTASYAWTASQAISASYLSGSSATVENLVVFGTASVKFLNVSIQSASVVLLSGSNYFGDAMGDTQYFTGSVGITGSLNVATNSPATIPNLTGSLFGTASYAWTASQAVTSSYLSGSSATIQLLNVVGTGSVKFFNSQDVTASTVTVTGSSKFGATLNTTHSFTGAVGITGSLTMPTYSIATLPTVIGDLIGTASWVATSSYTVIARSVVNVTSSAPAQEYSGSLWYNTNDGNTYVQIIGGYGATWVPIFGGTVGYATTASYAISSSYFSGTFTGDVTTSLSSSYVSGTSVDGYVLGAYSASLAENARTASYVQLANTASYVLTAQTASFVSVAQTASWISGSNVKGTVSSSFTASLADQAATSYTASYISGSNVRGTVSSSYTASQADTASWVSGSNVRGTVSSSFTASLANQAATSYTASYISGSNVKGTVSASFTASQADTSYTASYVSGSNVFGTVGSSFTASYVSGSNVKGTVSSSFTASQADTSYTASYVSGSNVFGTVGSAFTASLANQAVTSYTASWISGSNVYGTVSSSFTASLTDQAITSYTASYISGSSVDGTVASAFTASYLSGSSAILQNLEVLGTASVKYLFAQFETASAIVTTGSSYFGDQLTDTQYFTGSVAITGSIVLSGVEILTSVSESLNFQNDTEAAAAGVPLGGLYRNGNFILIRLS